MSYTPTRPTCGDFPFDLPGGPTEAEIVATRTRCSECGLLRFCQPFEDISVCEECYASLRRYQRIGREELAKARAAHEGRA